MNPETRMLLDRLEGQQEMNGYWTAKCPSHNDSKNSLVIKDGDKVPCIVKCHANKGCTPATICQAVGLTLSQIMPQSQGFKPSSTAKYGSLVAKFDYCDADGALLYQACRYEKETEAGKQKTFNQRRPNGKGGWVNNMKGVTRVLYNLPEIVHGDSTEPILVVEGEKHCDKLKEFGFIPTCNVGGASQKWPASYAKCLKGRDVVILPDNDDPGRAHARKVSKSLEGHARSVNVLILDGLPEKGDVLDWLAMGNTGEELRKLVSKVIQDGGELPDEEPAIDQESVDVDREIIKKIGIDVLGITEKGYIKVFSYHHSRVDEIRDVDRITLSKLLAICGPSVRFRVFDGIGDAPSGTFTLRQVKHAISVLAGFRVLDEDQELGIGIWRKCDDDKDHPSWVLVGASESAVLNGTLRRHAVPRFGDHILALSNNEPWYSFDQLSSALEVHNAEFSKQVCGALEDYFSAWKYAHQDESPALLAGLVLATWIQTAWPWRPQVALSGQSASGKSSMFNFLNGIFGRLCIKSSGPTAAGLRQAVGNTASIVLADEMEDSRDRPKFFEMLRSSGAGDQIIRGSASHKVQSFGLQHIVWIGSTETGLRKEADLNRFIKIEMVKPPRNESGSLPQLAPDVLRSFGVKTLVVAMKCFERASQLLRMFVEGKHTHHDRRITESFGVPISMFSAAMGIDDETAVDFFVRTISTMSGDEEIESNQEDLMDVIMSSLIKVDKEDESVSMALSRVDYNHSSEVALSNAGVRKCDDGLFIVPKTVERMLLRGTEYQNKSTREILKRLPGSTSKNRRLNGVQYKGVLIPMPDLKSSDEEDGSGFL